MSATTTEKLIVSLLSGLYEELKLKGDLDHKLVEQAVLNDDLWVLGWKYPGLELKVETPEQVNFVADVLDMFTFLKESYEPLSQDQKDDLEAQHEHLSHFVKYRGFDGNNESSYLTITQYLIDELDRFRSLEAPGYLNSHAPSVPGYRRMLEAFLPIRETLMGRRGMTADEIAQVGNAAKHPA